jgi:flagellar biosynthesis GTPase FlhF
MIGGVLIILLGFLLLGALFVAFIIGLIQPEWILRWSKKPTRGKVFGWWLLFSFILLVLEIVTIIVMPSPTPQEIMGYAKSDMEAGRYISAVDNLKQIAPEDSLYAEAQSLLAQVEPKAEAERKRIEEERIAKEEQERKKAEEKAKKEAEEKAAKEEQERKKAAEKAKKEAEEKASANNNKESSRVINPSSISTVAEAGNYIKGKTFITTPTGQLWYKVTFSGNSFTLWGAYPADGKWDHVIDTGKSYEVEERRYSDTGQRFFSVRLEGCVSLNISQLHFQYCEGIPPSVATEGDRNPWN